VTGDIIRDLQQTLNDKSYKAGPVDGIYGWQTTNAVRKYQSDNTMAGDGQLTIELVEALALYY
jgi:peptidoglycan hydrolase-like protein with peptidoglycan-binding domain